MKPLTRPLGKKKAQPGSGGTSPTTAHGAGSRRERNRGLPTDGMWWQEQVEVPVAGLPDAGKTQSRARMWRWAVFSAVFLLPITLFADLAMFVNTSPTTTAAAAPDRFAETRSLAIVTVRTWLGGAPSPLPGGTLVGWDKATVRRYTPPKRSSDTPYRLETHYLTLATSSGALFTTTVQVAVDRTHGPRVLGTPTLLPSPPFDTAWDANPYPSNDPINATSDVKAAVDSWATAFTSGDPAVLRQAVGDKTSAHSYVPLVGARLSDLNISGAYVVGYDRDKADPNAKATTVFVTIDASIEWATAPSSGTGPADSTTKAMVRFDLLVTGAATAAPVVVAWGGPGTGPSLRPYANAVTGRTVTVDPNNPTVPGTTAANQGGE